MTQSAPTASMPAHAHRHGYLIFAGASWPARPLIALVRLYQFTLSPLVGGFCRFQPTCSNYSIEALRRHGAAKGAWFTLRRLLRCHPWGGHGYDPVPGIEDVA